MKIATFALTLTVLGSIALVGCGDSSSSDPPAGGVAPGGTTAEGAGGASMPPMGAPTGGGMVPMGGGNKTSSGAGKGGRPSSFDGAPDSIRKQWGGDAGGQMTPPMGGMPGMGGTGEGGDKPSPINPGMLAAAARKDPFESIFKPVVQITPAWDYVINHRTEAPPKYTPPDVKTGDPDIDLPPLPPVPRRVAGVFYNGGITAILESGDPPTSDIDIVQPGAEISSMIPGVPTLTVESITMDNLILRAKDGRTVEVKLSGLAPAVRDSLRQQFSSGAGNGAGLGGMGGGMGPGAMGPGGGMGPGAAGGGKGGGAPLQ
jgi:hypothetical protein